MLWYLGMIFKGAIFLNSIITLEDEIFLEDAYKISDWLENDHVTKYISEGSGIGREIKKTIQYTTCPIVTHLFCNGGNFYMIKHNGRSVGYLKLIKKEADCEIVIVIGDDRMWNMGIGTKALKLAANEAFFNLRYEKMIAKIKEGNEGSKHIFEKTGFTVKEVRNSHHILEMEVMEFLKKAA